MGVLPPNMNLAALAAELGDLGSDSDSTSPSGSEDDNWGTWQKWIDLGVSRMDLMVGYPIPDPIIPRVYVGGKVAGKNKIVRDHFGITHVATVTDAGDCKTIKKMDGLEKDKWCYYPLNDKPVSNQIEEFPADYKPTFFKTVFEVHNFVKQAIEDDSNKVVIHCDGGQNRSVAVMAAYMMLTGSENSSNLEETMKCIQEARPTAKLVTKYHKPLLEIAEAIKADGSKETLLTLADGRVPAPSVVEVVPPAVGHVFSALGALLTPLGFNKFW